ncbi:MAG: hypothetical protein KY475_26525, partial [Planctomycetes bacterium]|nr:hypothetical protein [Planctomycetota bacterium]
SSDLTTLTRLVLEASLLAKLRSLTQPVELCAKDGGVLGRYFPALDPAEYDLEPKSSAQNRTRPGRVRFGAEDFGRGVGAAKAI